MSVAREYGSRAERVLRDLVEFGGLAAELVGRGKSAYDDDRQLQLAGEAIVFRLGKAAARLPEELVTDHPDIPFRTVKAMRNLVAHAYQRDDPRVVWATLIAVVPNFNHANTERKEKMLTNRHRQANTTDSRKIEVK